jgi:hypothetical protein
MSLIRNKPPQNLDRLTVFTTKGKSELAAKKVSD